jgi:hypothetical protein
MSKKREFPFTLQIKNEPFVVHVKVALVSYGHSESCFRDEVRITGSIANATATFTTKEVKCHFETQCTRTFLATCTIKMQENAKIYVPYPSSP